jgi:hypothetical protein
MSPYHGYGYLILLVWRIGFGLTGMELVQCDADNSRLCPVCDAESLWLVIILKSKDQFME